MAYFFVAQVDYKEVFVHMVCLAEDLQAIITSGELAEALLRLDELMESYHHRPSSRWRDTMLADIFEEAIRRHNVSVALRVLARTWDEEIREARRNWVLTIFGEVLTQADSVEMPEASLSS